MTTRRMIPEFKLITFTTVKADSMIRLWTTGDFEGTGGSVEMCVGVMELTLLKTLCLKSS